MRAFSQKLARDIYPLELMALIADGKDVETRGRATRELLDVYTEVLEPWHHCVLIPARHWNPWLALSEFLWIMAGRDDIAALEPYNSNICNYSDDGVTLYGAYGRRIYGQIDDLIERLRRDPNDRRAVLSVWEPGDLAAQTKDAPCNNLVYFKLREDKLHMTVLCRSNDLHWGLYAVNLPTFGLLQEYIASRLGAGVGRQAHLSNSLHIYVDDKKANAITRRMLKGEAYTPVLPYPGHRMAFEPDELAGAADHVETGDICCAILDGKIPRAAGPFLKFAGDFLTMYREHRWLPERLDQRFADWIVAGGLFVDQVWK